MRPPLKLLALLCTAAAVLAAALALALDRSSPHSSQPAGGAAGLLDSATGFAGAALPAGGPAHDFTLADQSGRPVSLRAYRGQVAIVAFVYSRCGAPCVLLAEQVRGALDELPRPVPVLFVSADPAADTPGRVRRFLARVSLGGRALYLRGSPGQLGAVWRAFGATSAAAGRAAFARAAAVRLLDGAGRERVVFGLEQLTPEGLAHDVRKLS
jgi:protein SCO1/2